MLSQKYSENKISPLLCIGYITTIGDRKYPRLNFIVYISSTIFKFSHI